MEEVIESDVLLDDLIAEKRRMEEDRIAQSSESNEQQARMLAARTFIRKRGIACITRAEDNNVRNPSSRPSITSTNAVDSDEWNPFVKDTFQRRQAYEEQSLQLRREEL